VLETTGRQLFGQLDRLRARGPATKVLLPGGLTAWSVSRGDVVKQLATHPDISKDARRGWPGHTPGSYPWLTAFVDMVSLHTADGEEHQRLRPLIAGAFSARRIEAMRPAITATVDHLLDTLQQRLDEGESVDLRALFCYPLPTRVVCDLFGVPDDQRASMLRVIDEVLDNSADAEQAARTGADLSAAMQTLLDTKRRHPEADMTSTLLAARDRDGDPLTEEELLSTLLLMIGAGSGTTVALLCHAVNALLTHPDQLAATLADPTRWDDVIDETLRAHPPVIHLPLRYATADIELGERTTIRKGDLVLLAFGAHGRDPGVHRDPDAFDIDRADKQHLAFGYGIHYCVGAPLARLQAGIALPALFARFPGLAGTGELLDPIPSFISGDVQAVPARIAPEHRALAKGR
jgi:cytochrome P450